NSADAPVAEQAAYFNASFIAEPGFVNWGSLLSDKCSYAMATRNSAAELSARTRPELAGVLDRAWPKYCDAWHVDKVDSTEFQPVVTDVRAFVIWTGLSTSASESAVDGVVALLSNVQRLDLPTMTGSFSVTLQCLNSLRVQFLADPGTDLPTRQCA